MSERTASDAPPDDGAVLITGAGKRIGRAIALGLAATGRPIAVHYRGSAGAAEAVAEEARRAGVAAITLQADLRDEAAARDLIPAATEALGPVTALINNASVFEDDAIETVNRETWLLHMDANLYAPLLLTQAFATALPADRRGCVVNIIDQRVWRLTPRFLSYTVSKAGLWTLTQTLAQALAPRIRVNGIGPGPTLQNARQDPADFQAQVDGVLLQRSTDPSEIVAAVRFLLNAPAVTGQMIALDGGQHLAWETPDVAGIPE